MKPLVLFVAFFLFAFSDSAMAQINKAQSKKMKRGLHHSKKAHKKSPFTDWTIGAKIGLNMQRTVGNPLWEERYSSGLMGGLYTNTNDPEDRWHIRAELLGRVGKVTYVNQREYKTTHMDLPLLFGYNVLDIIWLHAGPQFTLMTSARDLTGGSNVRKLYRPFDVNLAVGAEIYVTYRLQLAVRYFNGFLNQNKLDDPAPKWKNNGLQFTAGYAIFN
jgi:hypothetical protein